MADAPYGLLAEFRNETELVLAAQAARHEGYTRLDAFTPFPVEQLAAPLHFRDTRLPRLGVIGGLFGFSLALAIQAYVSWTYPLNVGGRPIYPLSAYAVVMFELTVLFSVLFLFVGLLCLIKLPRLNYPVFNASRFRLASKDRFFLCIKADDGQFDSDKTAAFLTNAGAVTVELVPS
ncbi:MAG: DUF3341 domain-containing protein [Rhizobiales bacterium]|nr:DUF3341 domain-containing protein [Hyphomicrobiales bacterium]